MKTGSSALRILLLQLVSSFIIGGILNLVLPGSASEGAYLYQKQYGDLTQAILDWMPQIGMTLLKIVILVN